MKTSKPVHGKARLVTEDGKQTLFINDVPYAVSDLRPDRRVAYPAVALTKADGTSYHVCCDRYGPNCDCGDFSFRGRFCKHIRGAAAVGLIPPVTVFDKEEGHEN